MIFVVVELVDFVVVDLVIVLSVVELLLSDVAKGLHFDYLISLVLTLKIF